MDGRRCTWWFYNEGHIRALPCSLCWNEGNYRFIFIIFIPFHNFHTIFLIIGSACLNLHRNIFSLNHDSHLKNTFDLDSACSLVMWSISRLVPYSSQKTKASRRRDFKILLRWRAMVFWATSLSPQKKLKSHSAIPSSMLWYHPGYFFSRNFEEG